MEDNSKPLAFVNGGSTEDCNFAMGGKNCFRVAGEQFTVMGPTKLWQSRLGDPVGMRRLGPGDRGTEIPPSRHHDGRRNPRDATRRRRVRSGAQSNYVHDEKESLMYGFQEP